MYKTLLSSKSDLEMMMTDTVTHGCGAPVRASGAPVERQRWRSTPKNVCGLFPSNSGLGTPKFPPPAGSYTHFWYPSDPFFVPPSF